ncbi:hypothetical protein THAOC_26395, partial [Thalassiosira oceanica]
ARAARHERLVIAEAISGSDPGPLSSPSGPEAASTRTRERYLGQQRGLSCSSECPPYADGSIGSVRGLRRPQTTIDASSVVNLSAPMCSRPSHEQFLLSHLSLLQAADVAGNQILRNRAQTPPRERDCLGGVSARFAIMSSVETAATRFNDSVGQSVGWSLY